MSPGRLEGGSSRRISLRIDTGRTACLRRRRSRPDALVGKFEFAQHGTVMLDEIGEIPAALQVKLLHVLQDRQFCRLGGNRLVHADVRVIAATNRDLEAMIRKQTFREDLYYRLQVIELMVPPLRERREEISAHGEADEAAGIDLQALAKSAAMRAEREAIQTALSRFRWNRRKAAEFLNVSYKTLLNKMRESRISDSEP